MFDTILEYAIPATQAVLIFALFGVAFLFVRLDGKLNAMKEGTDGVRQTIIDLNTALAQAQSAMNELKAASDQSSKQLAAKIEEANSARESLGFAASTAKALAKDLPSVRAITTHNNEAALNSAVAKARNRFDDLPPINENRRTEWGGLR